VDDIPAHQEPKTQHSAVPQIINGILHWLTNLIRWTEEDQENAGIHPGNQQEWRE
jgi:hypothetical protein